MSQQVEVKVPDIGDFAEIPVIEVCVQVGDTVQEDDALVTLESDKATMDVPSSAAGVVREIRVKVGDKIGEGVVVAVIEETATSEDKEGTAATGISAAPAPAAAAPVASKPSEAPAAEPAPPAAPAAASPETVQPAPAAPAAAPAAAAGASHASPSVRMFARQLGVDLAKVVASGPKGRVLKDDITAFVKSVMEGGTPAPAAESRAAAPGSLGGGLDLLPWPKIDFAKFGEVEVQPLSRIKKISAQNLARNWVMVPAVTYHDEADVTELEDFRQTINKENEKSKITMLAFIVKACELALKKFPEFNASLETDGGEMRLVLKKYFNIGFAADTPNGLVVPVIKNVDKKSVSEIARETGELAAKAREGKLAPTDMQGACFTISSVGGIGGTSFSPIVNAPEVAILGVSRSVMKPVWNGSEFAPRLVVPLALSADHRVIDGALATRFNVYLAQLLSDIRRVVL